MRGRVDVKDAPRADLHHHERVDRAKGCRRRYYEIASGDRSGVVPHEGRPGLIASSAGSTNGLRQVLAHGPWTERDAELDPQDGFTSAILLMSARRSGGTLGRPMGRDFHRHSRRLRSRSQRMSVAGRKRTNELRQSKNRESITSNRGRNGARRGRMPRSMTMASWRRRNRTSARRAMYARAVSVPEDWVQDGKKDLAARKGSG
jgi:hypothetical protein